MLSIVFSLLAQEVEKAPWEARKLGELPADLLFVRAHFSPGGGRVLCEAKRGDRFLFVEGSTPGEAFDAVDSLALSGGGYAYRGERGGRKFLVTERGVSGPLDGVGRPRFSSDGRRRACTARRGDSDFMIIDGREGPGYLDVSAPVFSEKGSVLAYIGRRGNDTWDVINGEEVAEVRYQVVWAPVFLPDGKTIAFPARRRDACFLVAGGREAPTSFQFVGTPRFSVDGRHVAYDAFDDGKHMLVLDHKPVAATVGKFSSVGEVGFTPDHRLYYQHWRHNYPNVDVGGTDLAPPGTSAGTPVFSPDGSRMAWLQGNETTRLVLDGKPVFEGEWMGDPVFSPDGRQVACVVGTRGRPVIIEENVVRSSAPRTVSRGGRSWVRVGDKKSAEFDEVHALTFSPDSKWIGFGTVRGRELGWQVLRLD